MTGAPPAEFGDKTSLVVSVTTKSGLGQKPRSSYQRIWKFRKLDRKTRGLAAGQRALGQFLRRQRPMVGADFWIRPEFRPMHDAATTVSLFNRIDWHPSPETILLHLNVWLGRSWFQTPNSYDSAQLGQDQRSQIRNANIAFRVEPCLHARNCLLSVHAVLPPRSRPVLSFRDVFADTPATLAQDRTLANTGFRPEAKYTIKRTYLKIGGTYWRTRSTSGSRSGLPIRCSTLFASTVPAIPLRRTGVRDPLVHASGFSANPDFLPELLPYDLSAGGPLHFEQAGGYQRNRFLRSGRIRLGRLILSPGLRYDIYNGLSRGRQLQPRSASAGECLDDTLLRASYARLYETPYNENLIFANESAQEHRTQILSATIDPSPCVRAHETSSTSGLQQRFGSHVTVDADYYWKFTHSAFDFDTLFNTPITFSVAWKKSKIDGLALACKPLNTHGFTAYSVMGHVRSRFFTPQVGGPDLQQCTRRAGSSASITARSSNRPHIALPKPVRRGKYRPWIAAYGDTTAAWRCRVRSRSTRTPSRSRQISKSQMGLRCGNQLRHPPQAFAPAARRVSITRVRIPALGTANDDRNPVRVSTPNPVRFLRGRRSVCSKWRRFTVGIRFSVLNVTNQRGALQLSINLQRHAFCTAANLSGRN